jgi:signal transduction histidine kinase
MAHALSAETDQLQASRHFSAQIAQATTFEEGISACSVIIQHWFAPQFQTVVWEFTQGHSTPLSAQAQQYQPQQNDLIQLKAGEVVVRYFDQVLVVFTPLVVKSQLRGWIVMVQPQLSDNASDLLLYIAGQAAPALAFLELSNRQDERVQHLQTLNEVGRLISGELDLTSLLGSIFQASKQLIYSDSFIIVFYEESTDTFDLAYFARHGQPFLHHRKWNIKSGLGGVVFRQRKPLRTNNYNQECLRHGVPPSPLVDIGIPQAWLGVPLMVRDKPLGVMMIGNMQPGASYSDEQVELMQTIAAQASVAIENAQLYQRSEQQARQLATINRIGRTITSSLDQQRVPSLIMEQICELLGVEEGSLLLLDDATGDLVFAYTTGPFGNRLLGQRLPRGMGLVGYVVSTGASVIVNDPQQDQRFYPATDMATGFVTRAILAVPLRGVGGIQGVIEVMNPRDGGTFTEDDQHALETVADQAVIALENAKRFAQVDQALARRAQELASANDMLQHNLWSLTALNNLSMTLNTNLHDANEIFTMTAYKVIEITEASGASVLLPTPNELHTTMQIGTHLEFPEAIQSILWQVIAHSRPLLINEKLPKAYTRQGIKSILAVPLRATQKVLGILTAYYPHEGPSNADQETVVLFANQAAVAVENLELFNAVREAHDHMASVLASTREGIMLIDPSMQIAIANDALYRICGLSAQAVEGHKLEQFIKRWERAAHYPENEWQALRDGLVAVSQGQHFASGELNPSNRQLPSVAWNALPAQASDSYNPLIPGGTLLVLHDITEAKESEQLRQDLTNMIVHDLRSPLSSVMTSIDMLLRGITGELNNSQSKILNITYASSLQMLDMINTLLDISRLESGRMPLNVKQQPLDAVVDRAINRIESLAQDRAMTLEVKLDQNLKEAFIDDEMVVRVVQNLLGNALNFSDRGSTITVLGTNGARKPQHQAEPVENSDQFITMAVQDTGVGIAPEDQAKIFTKFGQAGDRKGGTGLGLTFCKLATEAHGGQIWVESKLGEGSTFYFTLPIINLQSEHV